MKTKINVHLDYRLTEQDKEIKNFKQELSKQIIFDAIRQKYPNVKPTSRIARMIRQIQVPLEEAVDSGAEEVELNLSEGNDVLELSFSKYKAPSNQLTNVMLMIDELMEKGLIEEE